VKSRALAAFLAVLAAAPSVLAQVPAATGVPSGAAGGSSGSSAAGVASGSGAPPAAVSASPPATTSTPATASAPTAVPTTLAPPTAPKSERPLIEDPHGVPVTFDSKDVAMRVYIAHGDVPSGAIPDPFEKLPKLPVKVRLAPGLYTVEAESPNASTGHDHIQVEHDAPMTVDVHGGNASVKAFGGVFIAAGIVATILGVVSIVSISPNDSSFNRWGVGLPLTLGGLGLSGLGLGMTFLGSTDFVAPHLPPGGAPHRTVSLSVRF
jgi:hypothetical protein